MIRSLRFWLRLTVIGLAVIIGWLVIVPRLRAPARILPTLGQVQEFRLTSHTGQPFGLMELRGAVWVANFIFTRCQGPCPVMTGKMAALERSLANGDAVKFVSVSIDPQHDTPEVLAAYVQERGVASPRWCFLTGDSRKVHDLMREGFKLPLGALRKDQDEIVIPHSQKFVLVDHRGGIRGYYDSDQVDDLRDLRADIEALLRARSGNAEKIIRP